MMAQGRTEDVLLTVETISPICDSCLVAVADSLLVVLLVAGSTEGGGVRPACDSFVLRPSRVARLHWLKEFTAMGWSAMQPCDHAHHQ